MNNQFPNSQRNLFSGPQKPSYSIWTTKLPQEVIFGKTDQRTPSVFPPSGNIFSTRNQPYNPSQRELQEIEEKNRQYQDKANNSKKGELISQNQLFQKQIKEKNEFYKDTIRQLEVQVRQGKSANDRQRMAIVFLEYENQVLKKIVDKKNLNSFVEETKEIFMKNENQQYWQRISAKLSEFSKISKEIYEILPEISNKITLMVGQSEKNLIKLFQEHIERLSMKVLKEIILNEQKEGKQVNLYRQMKRSTEQLLIANKQKIIDSSCSFKNKIQQRMLQPLNIEIQNKKIHLSKINMLKQKIQSFIQRKWRIEDHKQEMVINHDDSQVVEGEGVVISNEILEQQEEKQEIEKKIEVQCQEWDQISPK